MPCSQPLWLLRACVCVCMCVRAAQVCELLLFMHVHVMYMYTPPGVCMCMCMAKMSFNTYHQWSHSRMYTDTKQSEGHQLLN